MKRICTFDIKVKDSTRSNNVYEGIISYDTKKINNFSIIQDTGWEVYIKEVDTVGFTAFYNTGYYKKLKKMKFYHLFYIICVIIYSRVECVK